MRTYGQPGRRDEGLASTHRSGEHQTPLKPVSDSDYTAGRYLVMSRKAEEIGGHD